MMLRRLRILHLATWITILCLAGCGGAAPGSAPATTSAMPAHGVRLTFDLDKAALPTDARAAQDALDQAAATIQERLLARSIGTAATIQERLLALSIGTPSVSVSQGRIVALLPPLPEAELVHLRAAFARRERLAFCLVANHIPETEAWSLAARLAPESAAGVSGDSEYWSNSHTGTDEKDAFLVGPTLEALEGYVTEVALRATPLASGRRVVYGPYMREPSPAPAAFRSYVVGGKACLVPTFAAAQVEPEDQVGGVNVRVTFDARGASDFAELTRANVGKKLAILVGDRVMSAPIVQSAITGGRVSIHMGAHPSDTVRREAEDLALSLRMTSLAVPAMLTSIENF